MAKEEAIELEGTVNEVLSPYDMTQGRVTCRYK
jgi:translation initiation factor IF-1